MNLQKLFNVTLHCFVSLNSYTLGLVKHLFVYLFDIITKITTIIIMLIIIGITR